MLERYSNKRSKELELHYALEPYAMKVARTVLGGGKSEKTYLSLPQGSAKASAEV